MNTEHNKSLESVRNTARASSRTRPQDTTIATGQVESLLLTLFHFSMQNGMLLTHPIVLSA
jgi:hypothetical protein